jgi:hypothetical protein
MSWNVSTGQQRPQNVIKAINELEMTGDVATWNQDFEDQLAAAKKAAVAIFKSGCCGDPQGERDFIVSMNGHSNPGHAPRPGFSSDTVTVTVTQVQAAVSYSR